MIRAPLINPLLLLLAAQARPMVEAPPGDSWQGLAALRASEDDAKFDHEQTLAKWREHWPQGTRQSFEAACQHKWFSEQAEAVQPCAIAQAISQGTSPPPSVCVLPWSVSGRRYPPTLVDAMIEAKLRGEQVWLDVPSVHTDQAAQESLVRDGLRLGCAWFLRPPASADQQDSYVKAMRAWTHQILTHASFDQWVWPWGEILIKGMASYASAGATPKRQGSPAGWPVGDLRWAQLTRDVVQDVCGHWGTEQAAKDLFMGLLGAFEPSL
jgi:hypothetical protein